MRYVMTKVRRDTQTVSNSATLPWEVPILKYLFEYGNVTEGEYTSNDAEYPNAAAEFERLVKVYGADSNSGIPHVISVYGEGRRGLNALREAIEDAEAADVAAQKPARATRKSSRKAASDPLMV